MKGTLKNSFVTLVITLVCFLSVTYTACKKTETTTIDECANVDCKNGSTCFKGMCSCLSGFEGTHCEIVTINRFIGKWSMKERITGSSKADNLALTKDYDVTIKAQGDSKITFLIDDFMGNASYDNIVCTEARNEKYEPGPYTSFVFEKGQNIKTSTGVTSIVRGAGDVNALGTFFDGSYIISYGENNVLITDTISFSASLEQ
jgi:hypothetical protein